MPKVNHTINRYFIKKLGDKEGLKEIKEVFPKWRISSGGLAITLRHDAIKKAHGKASASDDAKKFKCSVNTIYDNRKKKS